MLVVNPPGPYNQVMKLYCYHIPPIDYWFGAITGEQLLATAWERCHQDWNNIVEICREVATLKTEAEAAFKTISWEGDITEEPYYFALPRRTNMSIGYIIKQSNNGNCFIASPETIPSFESLAFEKTVIG